MRRVLLLCFISLFASVLSAQSTKLGSPKAGNPFGTYVLFDQINNHNETYQIPTHQFP